MITPDYFFTRLKICEAHDLLKELEERDEHASRIGFIHQRFTAGIIYKTLTGKVLDITFPWEEEDDATPDDGSMTEEEVAETRRMLQELNKKPGQEWPGDEKTENE